MRSLAALLRIVAQRSMANWRLLLTVVLGVVLASGLMSSVVLYSDAVRDLGLDFTLRQEDPLDLDLKVVGTSQNGEPSIYADRRETTLSLLEGQAGGILEGLGFYGRSSTFYLTEPGGTVPDDELRPRAHFVYFSDIEEHVRLLNGAERQPAAPTTDPEIAPSFEVWMSAEGAAALEVAVGDTFDLHPFWRDDVAPVTVTVAGLIEPEAPAEEYWFGGADRLVVDTTRWPTYVLVIDEAAFANTIAPYLPNIDGTFETYGFVDTGRIDSRNAEEVELRLNALSDALRRELPLTSLDTELADTIASYRDKLFFTRLPLFALMLLIVGIALYYLVLVVTMLVERQAGEIALLKSRGAGIGQIMTVYLVEGLALTVFAVVLGPLLAAGAIRLLGPTPPFEELSDGQLLDVTLTPAAFGMAFLGAVLALAALLWPAYRAAIGGIISYKLRLARPPQQPLFLRYYLDLALVGVGAFLFYQLRQRGSLVTERLFDDLSADPLLLVSPALFMLMIALVFLRLFPLILRGVAWLLRGLGGATVLLGLWRMVRSPLHYSRLILLLLLATSVGMFAAGFGATLDRSFEDRAAYEAGAGGRVTGIREPARTSAAELEAMVEAIPGLDGAAAATRLSGSYVPERGGSSSVSLLAVSESFEDAAFWRNDFAGQSLGSLLGKLEVDAEEPLSGVEIPAGTRYLAIWAQISLPGRAAVPALRIEDDRGVLWEYLLFSDPAAEEPSDGWRLYVTDLAQPWQPRNAVPNLDQPRTLDAVFLSLRRLAAESGRVTAVFDDVLALPDDFPATGRLDGATVLEDFEALDRYESITAADAQGEASLIRAETDTERGEYAAQVTFTYESFASQPIVGVRVRRPATPLPVLASEDFLRATETHVGDTLTFTINRQRVSVLVVDDFELFPGYLPTERSPLIVTALADLQVAAAGVPRIAQGITPNEVWVRSVTGGTLTLDRLAEWGISANATFDQDVILALKSSDPLVAASWEGILFLSFAAVLLLTALGFIVFSFLAAQTRALEFAILRTMGFSGRQILGVVAFEQLFVIVAGVAAGTALGFPLGRLMIGALSLTEDGSDVVPPLLSQVSWGTVLTVYALLAAVFLATVAALARLYSRLALHRALRIGEL